ncbi:hypothetical protein D3C71_1868920 [compost metagenome]
MQRDAVHGCGHAEFTHAEVNVAAIIRFRRERSQSVQMRHRGALQVGGTAEQLRNAFGQAVQRVAGSNTGGHRFVFCCEERKLGVPSFFQIAV